MSEGAAGSEGRRPKASKGDAMGGGEDIAPSSLM